MEQHEYPLSFATEVSSAPDTQYLIDKLTNNYAQHNQELSLHPQSYSCTQFHSFSTTLQDADYPYSYDDPESQLPDPYYNPSLPPPLPSWAPTPYGRLIPVSHTSTTSLLNLDEKAILIEEATSEAYLKLYKSGELEARVDEKGVWELHCVAGCWVRTSIPSRIPLTSKGQFATLEAHVRGKSCRGHAQKLTMQDSRAALAMTFPPRSQPVSSPLPSHSKSLLSTPSSFPQTTKCPGYMIKDWPTSPGTPVYANFPWLRTRDGKDKLPFDIELVTRTLFARSLDCIGLLDMNNPLVESCFPCSSLAPKIALLAKNAEELSPHTRRTIYTPLQLLDATYRLDEELNIEKLKGCNDSRTIQHLRNTLTDHSALIMALSQQDIPYLRQLFSTSLRNGASISTILRTLEHALEHGYRPRNHKQESLDLAALIYRLGGRNLLYAVTQRFPLPSLRTLRNHTSFVKIAPTVGRISSGPIIQNLKSLLFETRNSSSSRRGVSILIDETALDEASVYIPEYNAVGGLCWLHAHNIDITLRSYQSALNIAQSLKDGKVHLAKEITVVVARLFGEDGVYPLLAAPTCKTEQASDMEFVISTVIDTYIANGGEQAVGPLWTLATDGDATRRKACHRLLVRDKLPIHDPIYGILSNLPGLNLFTGRQLMTLDPDFKHNIKRFSTSLRSRSGVYVNYGHCINTFMLERYLTWVDGIDEAAARRLLYPDDAQDVPRAVELLTTVIKLGQLDLTTLQQGPFDLGPDASTMADFDALRLLSYIYESLLEPYINIKLSLSQQITHLSRLSHLLFICYRDQARRFIPNPLYYDTQSMIKTVMFNVAKQQLLNPSAPYALVEGGDDALESLFAFLRMSGGHHSALNHREANDRLGAARNIADIFSRNPDLNNGHRRLNLRRKESVDHVSRSNWVGDIISGHCDLPSSWCRGRDEAMDILRKSSLSPSTYDFHTLFGKESDIDLLRVFGGNKYPSVDGTDDDGEGTEEIRSEVPETGLEIPGTTDAENEVICPGEPDDGDFSPSFEDELSNQMRQLGLSQDGENDDEDHTQSDPALPFDDLESLPPKGPGINPKDYLWCERRWVHKQSVCRIVITPVFTPKSHDRLMRVRGFTAIHKSPYNTDTARILHGDQFIVGDIFLTFVRTPDKKLALALLRAMAIIENGTSRGCINSVTLTSPRGNVKVTGDIMVLLPSQNDTQASWIWNGTFCHVTTSSTASTPANRIASLAVPGHLTQPINPPVLDASDYLLPANLSHINSKGTTWVITDEALLEVIATLWKKITDNKIPLTTVPNLVGTSEAFPYRDLDGTPSLLCLVGMNQLNAAHGKGAMPICPVCATKAPDIRSHMGAHILQAARGVQEKTEAIEAITGSLPCGFCGCTGEVMCATTVKELAKSTTYTSNCPLHDKFQYKSAFKGSANRPCRNVPIVCRLCYPSESKDTRPAIWRYNMEAHLNYQHPEYAHPGKPDGIALPRHVYDAIYLTTEEQELAGVITYPVFTNIEEKENDDGKDLNTRSKKRKQNAETFVSAIAAAKRARHG